MIPWHQTLVAVTARACIPVYQELMEGLPSTATFEPHHAARLQAFFYSFDCLVKTIPKPDESPDAYITRLMGPLCAWPYFIDLDFHDDWTIGSKRFRSTMVLAVVAHRKGPEVSSGPR